MSNPHFSTSISVPNSAQEVYTAINNVALWWQGSITGMAMEVGHEFEYRMLHFHFSKHRVIELIPFEKIVWLTSDSNLNSFENAHEWTGTTITFHIVEQEDHTTLTFTHEGLNASLQCFADCSGAWTALIQQSLFSLITTGMGKKVF